MHSREVDAMRQFLKLIDATSGITPDSVVMELTPAGQGLYLVELRDESPSYGELPGSPLGDKSGASDIARLLKDRISWDHDAYATEAQPFNQSYKATVDDIRTLLNALHHANNYARPKSFVRSHGSYSDNGYGNGHTGGRR